MKEKKRYSTKHILSIALWVLLGLGTSVLLIAAVKKKDSRNCRRVAINIEGVSNNFFVDKNDILHSISTVVNSYPVGKSIGSFNLRKMEVMLEKNTWIKSAELFFDNNEVLRVNVHEREPIARIFTAAGTTFYIDNDISILPLSDKFSARLPVFTNFPANEKSLSKADSILLKDIKIISLAIQEDTFTMAMIEQTDITQQRTFEMVPKVGNQAIVFGNAKDATEKLHKLKLFYKEVIAKAGWNNYSVIDLQYKNQVVAKKRGMEDVKADSLRTLQAMQFIATAAEKKAGDSLQKLIPEDINNTVDSNLIQQSRERNDETGAISVIEDESMPTANNKKEITIQKVETKPGNTVIKKPAIIKPALVKSKTTMPKKKENK